MTPTLAHHSNRGELIEISGTALEMEKQLANYECKGQFMGAVYKRGPDGKHALVIAEVRR